MSKIEPCGFNVLVEPIEIEARTAGGILLPDAVIEKEQYAAQRGKIVAVGPAAKFVTADHIGKTAIYGRYAGAMIEEGGRKFRLIDNEDIKGIVDG